MATSASGPHLFVSAFLRVRRLRDATVSALQVARPCSRVRSAGEQNVGNLLGGPHFLLSTAGGSLQGKLAASIHPSSVDTHRRLPGADNMQAWKCPAVLR